MRFIATTTVFTTLIHVRQLGSAVLSVTSAKVFAALSTAHAGPQIAKSL